MEKNKWFLNGGRGSGRTLRLLCETYENKIANLEKENAELKEQIRLMNEQDFLVKRGGKMTEELQKKAEDFIIDRYKIAECYREDSAETREYMRMDVHSQYEEEYQLYLDATKELQKELKKWKDEWQEQVQKATDEGYARTLQTVQLTKAKEIIREFVEWATWQGNNCPSFKDIQDKAEQFLQETDINNAIQQANKGLYLDKIANEMEQDLKDSEVEK